MIYRRHRRHSTLRGIERGRLKKANAFYEARILPAAQGGIGDTGAIVNFTVDDSTDIFTSAAHGLSTGHGPFVLTTSDTLPAGLAEDTNYWVEVIDANTFYLHTSRNFVTDSSKRVDVSDTGTGTQSYSLGVTKEDMIEYVNQGVTTPVLQKLTDVDDVLLRF